MSKSKRPTWSRRTLLQSTAYAAALGLPHLVRAAVTTDSASKPDAASPNATPFRLDAVRLKPSVYLTAIQSNGAYLLRLEPDRLLHNFRVSAKLPPKGAVYGGWESESLAGHSLGHYLSACSLMFAQTGDPAYRDRVNYIVAELIQCQQAHGDGYVAGFTRKRGETVEDGKIIFAEIARGDIHSLPFSLNGGWSRSSCGNTRCSDCGGMAATQNRARTRSPSLIASCQAPSAPRSICSIRVRR